MRLRRLPASPPSPPSPVHLPPPRTHSWSFVGSDVQSLSKYLSVYLMGYKNENTVLAFKVCEMNVCVLLSSAFLCLYPVSHIKRLTCLSFVMAEWHPFCQLTMFSQFTSIWLVSVFAVINITEMNILFRLFFFEFICLRHIPQSGTAGSEVGNYYQPCSVFPDFSMKAISYVRIHSYFPIAPLKLALSF